ncbi:MAG: lysylphosphatidylglycerol synthase transmembrane domain-containing protein [Chloroflexi bacterium]|nr:lysylphosphatidylglycerol synthase transmembrane domain-containing protein [Chloroflexota bacterium]
MSIMAREPAPVDMEHEGSGDDLSLQRRLLNRRTFLSFLIALGLLGFFFSRYTINVDAVLAQLRGVHLPTLALAAIIYFGLRWRLLLNNVGISEQEGQKIPSVAGLSEIILLGWFVNCIVPAKLGDAYRAYLLKKAAKTSFSTTAGTVLAERLVDMLVLFVLLCGSAIGLTVGLSQDRIFTVLLLGFAMFAVIITAIVTMALFGARLRRFLPQRIQPMYLRFHQGTLGSFRQLPLVTGLTLLVWVMEASRMLLVTRSLGLALDFHFVLFVALANSLLTVVPFTPGGLGLVENGAAELLMRAGVTTETAIAVVLLDRGISYWLVVATGGIAFMFSKKR